MYYYQTTLLRRNVGIFHVKQPLPTDAFHLTDLSWTIRASVFLVFALSFQLNYLQSLSFRKVTELLGNDTFNIN